MSRPYFESPVHVEPLDESTTKVRAGGPSAGRILAIGVAIIGVIIGIAQLQKLLARDDAPTVVKAFFDEATREGKLVALVFTSEYSDKCVRMDHQCWNDEAVRDIVARRYYFVRLNIDDRAYREYIDSYQVEVAPTIVLTTARGSVLLSETGEPMRHEGYLGPSQLRTFLAAAAAGPSPRQLGSAAERAGGNQRREQQAGVTADSP